VQIVNTISESERDVVLTFPARLATRSINTCLRGRNGGAEWQDHCYFASGQVGIRRERYSDQNRKNCNSFLRSKTIWADFRVPFVG